MRKEVEFTITDEGRDKGKVFVLREMPVFQAEKWAIRALLALNKHGVGLGYDPGAGMAAFAGATFRALSQSAVEFGDIEPLLDEMLTCVFIRPGPDVVRPFLLDGDIEEITTLFKLRAEVFKLHVDFSQPGAA